MSMNTDIMNDYAELTAFIDIDGVLKRVVGNRDLLFRLLRNFKGWEMAAKVAEAAESGDSAKLAYEAHKMKGVSANLGLKGIESVLHGIESCAKAGQDAMDLVPVLDAVVEETMRVIEEMLKDN